MWGRPPVATITTSGFSASTVSSSAKLLKWKVTPIRVHSGNRQSISEIISCRRGVCAVRRTWPPGSFAASWTITSWPRSAATRAASSPAGPAPTITTRRLASALAIACGCSSSRPVDGLCRQSALPPW